MFNGEYLQKNWYPRTYSDSGKPSQIPCTSDWKADHLLYFNIHHIRTNKDDWQHCLCPRATLTPDAEALSNYKFSAIEFSLGILTTMFFLAHIYTGLHEKPPNDKDPKELRDFGNTINELVGGSSSEATVDHLARQLVITCNPDRYHLLPISRLSIQTKVITFPFTLLSPLILLN
jgi:hypothetical protein